MSSKQDLFASWHTENIATIDDFLTAEECQHYIGLSEQGGYDGATITTESGGVLRPEVRNNDRYILDDKNIAALLWQRMSHLIENPYHNRWEPLGLNERLRFYRYDPGQKFDWHRDGHFARDENERSLLTFMVYLNEECEGGETLFGQRNDTAYEVVRRVRPKTGTALMFLHRLLHKGDTVDNGQKYVMRTDVMFRRLPY